MYVWKAFVCYYSFFIFLISIVLVRTFFSSFSRGMFVVVQRDGEVRSERGTPVVSGVFSPFLRQTSWCPDVMSWCPDVTSWCPDVMSRCHYVLICAIYSTLRVFFLSWIRHRCSKLTSSCFDLIIWFVIFQLNIFDFISLYLEVLFRSRLWYSMRFIQTNALTY